jgi:hypothetical protein
MKMVIKEMECEGVHWVSSALWRILVRTVMNIRAALRSENFFNV